MKRVWQTSRHSILVTVSLFVLLQAGLASYRPVTAQISDRVALVAALDSSAAAHAADSTVAGIAVAVIHRGETLLNEGYGLADLEFEVPMPRDAVFEIGSVTKQFTAAAILQLAEKDSIDLDGDVTDLIPGFNTRGHRVTPRQLLHHTSGIRSYTNKPEFWDLSIRKLPRDTLVAMIEGDPLRFAPGTAMSYSNSGYFLLGLIIEEASGQSYESYVEQNLFAAAGMKNSLYCNETIIKALRAHGYAWSSEGTLRRKAYLDHTWPFAAGSLCSSTLDLVAWNRALHGGKVLSDSMYAVMTAPGRLADGTELRYGMGLGLSEVDGRRAIGHGGGINGFLSTSNYFPADELVVVVLQNSTGPRGPGGLAQSLARLVLGESEEQDLHSFDGDLSMFEGRYTGPGRGAMLDLIVETDDRALTVRRNRSGASADTLSYMSDLTWREGSDEITFIRFGEQIVELRLDVGGGHYVLRRIREP